MKIKHYQAADMRQALRQVRDAQGPDAVILSSRKINGGVEVVAAVDYDGDGAVDSYGQDEEPSYGQYAQDAPGAYADERQQSGGRGGEDFRPHPNLPPATGGGDQRARAAAHVLNTGAAQTGPSASSQHSSRNGANAPARVSSAATSNGAGQRASASAESYAALSKRLSQPNDRQPMPDMRLPDANSDVNEELRTLRRMLETQLATLAWNDLSRRAPVQTEMLKQLSVLGLGHDLCGELVAQLPSHLELNEAHRLALALIARRIETVDERWIDTGGVIAMVGATGVGKTTLIAKLAARWVLRHGPRDLALISTDSVRIGAQEQIHTLGRLLGTPAYAIDGPGELPDLLDHLTEKRLVLIDTAGLSQRDPRLATELATLAGASERIEVSLVLSSAAQAGAIEEAVDQFAPASPATCVLTKLDEATSLGGAISALLRSKLPLAYVSDGQRVPEDLNPARAHQLIARAVELSRKSGASADEDLLRRRFGSVAHALA
jgi:flagellar biosynthesis protein FlhF